MFKALWQNLYNEVLLTKDWLSEARGGVTKFVQDLWFSLVYLAQAVDDDEHGP